MVTHWSPGVAYTAVRLTPRLVQPVSEVQEALPPEDSEIFQAVQEVLATPDQV
jgi:hypothetical protein